MSFIICNPQVKDENEAPTGIKLDNNQVEENIEGGTVIGTFSTEDPDRGQTFTYTLLPGDSDGTEKILKLYMEFSLTKF